MTIQKYAVNQYSVQALLTWVQTGAIAIPEIQRPFVWSATQVRDLIDSLYTGYPVGYLIAWKNPHVRLKDGSISEGKRILIDGQQRVTALMSALLGMSVVNKDYRKMNITIAFNPIEQRFEVTNPAIQKDKQWLPNITDVLSPDVKMLRLVKEYCEQNEGTDQDEIYESIELLRGIVNNHIGLIELDSDLDIETVTEIFIRINSKGTVLSQADFVMSKIAANDVYGGNLLRKCIDYFCHLAIAPEFYEQIKESDTEFANTNYFSKMSWLRKENDDLYDPSYTDMLRVAFMSEFQRAKLGDLVALLSGRNFETREYEETIAEQSFRTLEKGIMRFMNETDFKRFLMIIRSAGFIETSMIRSRNALNVAYTLYLTMRNQNECANDIESCVRRWFVMSLLTGHYSGSAESTMNFDIKQINECGAKAYLRDLEKAELSDAFWDAGLPQAMNTSVATSPYFYAYLAAQVHANDKGFLSKDITVHDLITHRGDIHHLFPRSYLKKHDLTKGKYNQIANYVMMQSEINIAVGDQAPKDYFTQILEQCVAGQAAYGGITSLNEMKANFAAHCIPEGIETMDVSDYEDFLYMRRRLIADKIRHYYQNI